MLSVNHTFFSGQAWDIVARTVTAITSVVVCIRSVLWFFGERERKCLKCDIVKTPVLRDHKDVDRKLSILFNGRPVQDVGVVNVRLWNSGNRPIAPEDYNQAVRIYCSGNVQILTFKLGETQPPNIEVELTPHNGHRHDHAGSGDVFLEVERILLNKGDSVAFQFLITGVTDTRLSIVGHICGAPVHEWHRIRMQSYLSHVSAIIVNAIVIVAMMAKSTGSINILFALAAPAFIVPYLPKIVEDGIGWFKENKPGAFAALGLGLINEQYRR